MLDIHDCYSGKMNTLKKPVDLVNPTPEMMDPEVIAKSLSRIARFGGHTVEPWTVGQHTILVMRLWAQEESKRIPLFHDAAEAFIGDVVKPLKILLGDNYALLEQQLNLAIAQRYKVYPTEQELQYLKACDLKALEIEHQVLQCGKLYGSLQLMHGEAIADAYIDIEEMTAFAVEQWLLNHFLKYDTLSPDFKYAQTHA